MARLETANGRLKKVRFPGSVITETFKMSPGAGMDRYCYHPCREYGDNLELPSKATIRKDTQTARRKAKRLRKHIGLADSLCLAATPESESAPDRTWILDSGSCVDLVRKSDLTNDERERIKEAQEPERLLTANGLANADKEVLVHIGSCGSSARALVMDD